MSYRFDDMNMPGPGDPETWPACTDDPMDPRTPDESREWDEWDREVKLDYLCERYGWRELAAMLLRATDGEMPK